MVPAPTFSTRVDNLHASPIREILAVAQRPGMISFAGGLPAPESFPIYANLQVPPACMQYGPSEGEPALRERIAEEMQMIGLDCTADQILLLSGSQQGIDLVAKLFIDRGSTVAVESPTYLAALQVFRFFGAHFTPLRRGTSEFWEAGANLAYVIPTFQNPTGHCYSRIEREAVAGHCDATSTPLFEDDPYRELAYDDCDRTPICSLLTRAPWIYQSSFSKTLAPGMRLGYLAASRDLMAYLVRLKQAADLHCNRISQWLVLEYLNDPDRGQRLVALRATYRKKRDRFAQLLDRHFADIASWQIPPGGLFFWLSLNRAIDTRTHLGVAIKQQVAYMPGEAFFADGDPPLGHLRLNFSLATESEADRGLAILAALFRQNP